MQGTFREDTPKKYFQKSTEMRLTSEIWLQ